MHRYHCSPTIRVPQVNMATSLPEYLEPDLGECPDQKSGHPLMKVICLYSDSLNPNKVEFVFSTFAFGVKT